MAICSKASAKRKYGSLACQTSRSCSSFLASFSMSFFSSL